MKSTKWCITSQRAANKHRVTLRSAHWATQNRKNIVKGGQWTYENTGKARGVLTEQSVANKQAQTQEMLQECLLSKKRAKTCTTS